MNTDPELKPCPWCPDAPITNANGAIVRCKSHTRWMTIDAWNRRAPITEQPVAQIPDLEYGEIDGRLPDPGQAQDAPCGFCLTYPGECPEHTSNRAADTSPHRIALIEANSKLAHTERDLASLRAQLEAVTREKRELKDQIQEMWRIRDAEQNQP